MITYGEYDIMYISCEQQETRKNKMSKSKYTVWGSSDYLKEKFDDIDNVKVMSRKTKATMAIKAMVKPFSNKKNNAYVYHVYKCTGKFDGEPVETKIAIITMGLNGPGKCSDYYDTIARIMKKNPCVRVIDVHVDAIDDLVDFMVSFK